jgi:hypothetical protein
MWEASIEQLQGGRVLKLALTHHGGRAAYRQVIRAWQQDAGFSEVFLELLAAAPFEAYFWETPPVNTATLDRPFEFVLVDAPALTGLRPTPAVYAEHFTDDATVAAFPNLGADAWLVAPSPRLSDGVCTHLASYSRSAPQAQQRLLWQLVGVTLERHLGNRPLWVSTSGLGAAWLHVRIDTRPKYYTYEAYREL